MFDMFDMFDHKTVALQKSNGIVIIKSTCAKTSIVQKSRYQLLPLRLEV